MAFPENKAALMFDLGLDIVLFILGMVSMIALATNVTNQYGNCQLFYDYPSSLNNGTCNFSITSGALIAVAAVVLFVMDWATWKSSESYKKRNMSVAALVLAIVMSLLSISTAVVVDLGIKKTCDNKIWCHYVNQHPGYKGIHTGIICSSLAGICFASYAICEFILNRRRQ